MAVFECIGVIFANLLSTCVYAQLTNELTRSVLQRYGVGHSVFVATLTLPKGENLMSAHFAGINRRIATGVKINRVFSAL